jgi:hypothetical protein
MHAEEMQAPIMPHRWTPSGAEGFRKRELGHPNAGEIVTAKEIQVLTEALEQKGIPFDLAEGVKIGLFVRGDEAASEDDEPRKKIPRTGSGPSDDASNKDSDDVETFLREKGYTFCGPMLMHSNSLDYWEELWDKYGDLGGHCRTNGVRVRTPWAGPPPEYWSDGVKGQAAMERFLKRSPAEVFLRAKGYTFVDCMLRRHDDLKYWETLWETFGDCGGNLRPDGTHVKTPWAGPPPKYWRGGVKGQAAMKRFLKSSPANAETAKSSLVNPDAAKDFLRAKGLYTCRSDVGP